MPQPHDAPMKTLAREATTEPGTGQTPSRPSIVACSVCGREVSVGARGPIPNGHRDCLNVMDDMARLKRDVAKVCGSIGDDRQIRLALYRILKREIWIWLEREFSRDKRDPKTGRLIA